MTKIIMDCDLMKHKNSGLYYYCLNLGLHVKKILDQESSAAISFYGDPIDLEAFNNPCRPINQRSWLTDKRKLGLEPVKWYQKFYRKPTNEHIVWHAPFQSGRVLPRPNKFVKILLTIHDLNPLHENIFTDEQRAASLSHTQSLIDKSDALVCISEFSKQDVLRHLDVKHKPIHVIHNGSNPLGIPPVMTVGYQPSRPFLFTLGYVNRKKNFKVLIPLLKSQPNLELVIAGKIDEPDYLHDIEALAISLGVRDRVHVAGQISDADKAWYLKNCLAFMFPSLAEGFGLPVTEAMTFGKPLFLSNRTSLPEIGGDVAFYFADFDPVYMNTLFSESMIKYEKDNMAEKIIQRGTDFCWEKSAKKYIEVYKTLR